MSGAKVPLFIFPANIGAELGKAALQIFIPAVNVAQARHLREAARGQTRHHERCAAAQIGCLHRRSR